MPTAVIDGIEIYYETCGSGTPLLMLAPGGFDSTIEKWRVASAWTGIDALARLGTEHQVIAYDRREAGQSGGRVERLTWTAYAREGKLLLDHLGIDSAFVMGGCMGCSVALAFGVNFPEATRGMILHWPVGGYRWKAASQARFAAHLNFVRENGIDGVVDRASKGTTFWTDPESGPWASVIARDRAFAERFAAEDPERYMGIIATSGPDLFDRDTATGATAEEVMGIKAPAVIMPGDDPSHATSGAHYLRECLPNGEFWNVMPPEQTTENVCDRALEFTRAHR